MCEPKSSAAAVVAGAVVGLAVVKAAGVVLGVAEEIALAVFAACGVSLLVLVRLLMPARRPVRMVSPVTARAELVRAPYEIEPPPLMIEAPRQGLTASQAPATKAAVMAAAVSGASRRAGMEEPI